MTKYEERRAAGLCVSCGVNAYGLSLCTECMDKAKKRDKIRRERRKQEKVCKSCPNPVDKEVSETRCKACHEAHTMYRQIWDADKSDERKLARLEKRVDDAELAKQQLLAKMDGGR